MRESHWRWTYLVAGLVLRAALMLWGRYQDTTHAVSYTDVDYYVFSDAAKIVYDGCPLASTVQRPDYESDADLLDRDDVHCARGFLPAAARFLLLNDPINHAAHESSSPPSSSHLFRWANLCYGALRPVIRYLATLGDPYARPTYRYTPFLATALTPIHAFGWPAFGKYIFAGADLLCAVLMWLILDGRRPQGFRRGVYVHLPGLMWVLNPIPAQISTRGSSEALVGLMVLLFVHFFLKCSPEAPLGLQPDYTPTKLQNEQDTLTTLPTGENGSPVFSYRPLVPEHSLAPLDWSIEAFLAPILHGLATHLKIFPVIYGIPILAHLHSSTLAAYDPTSRRKLSFWTKYAAGIQFGLVSFLAFMYANALAWGLWGAPFIEQTFTYHLHRVDHRHNFSPYFLSSYLSSFPLANSSSVSGANLETSILHSPLLAFGPQLLVVVLLGYELGKRDVIAAMTAQTIGFVAFNKVCTSQYFLWFLWLLPLVWPSLGTNRVETVVAALAWIGAQAVWLSQAYKLEFEAQQVFARVWASGLLLLVVHAVLLGWFVSSWASHRLQVLKHGLVPDRGALVKTAKAE